MRDLLVLTNALTDLVRAGTDEEVARRGLDKGHAHSNDGRFRESDLNGCRIVHGGSPGNVAAGAAHLGLACGLIGTVGTDDVGRSYVADIVGRGVESLLRRVEGSSGMCWVIVTPDGERTMAVDLGVSPRFEIPTEAFRRYRAFHCSGYEVVSNPEAAWKAIESALQADLVFSFDVADAQMVKLRPADIRRAAEEARLLFANEHEARALTGLEPEAALESLARPDRIVAVKLGSRGSLVAAGRGRWRIPSQAIRVVDTTGAGDAYAAGFLTGHLRDAAPEECGRRGTEFAARICGIEGARLPIQ